MISSFSCHKFCKNYENLGKLRVCSSSLGNSWVIVHYLWVCISWVVHLSYIISVGRYFYASLRYDCLCLRNLPVLIRISLNVFGDNYIEFVVVQVKSQNKIILSNTKECLSYVDHLVKDRHSCKIYFTNFFSRLVNLRLNNCFHQSFDYSID